METRFVHVHVIHAFLGAFINATLLILLVQWKEIYATIYEMVPRVLLWRCKKKIVKRGKSGLMTHICGCSFDIYVPCVYLITQRRFFVFGEGNISSLSIRHSVPAYIPIWIWQSERPPVTQLQSDIRGSEVWYELECEMRTANSEITQRKLTYASVLS